MIILDINKVSKSFGFGKLLDSVSFSINEGERVAIVGQNGSGKSTLLKMIAKIEKVDEGTISIKKDAVVEYLEQGDVADTWKGKCIDILKSAFEKLNNMHEHMQELESKLSSTTNAEELDVLVRQYSNLQEKFMLLGGYDIDLQINTVVNGLKIDKTLLDREFSLLSGGERTLINLAKNLLSKPDLLLLDEPTNHLDISRIEWLESYINTYKGTIIFVSHDRYFLDKVANKVVELDDGKANIYVGNYTKYLEEKENEEVKEFQIYKVQQKKIEEMEKAIKKLKEWGKMANNPTFFRRAKAIESNMNRLKAVAVEKPKETKSLPINFVATTRGSEFVIDAKNCNLIIGEKQLLIGANCQVLNKEKVAIVGDNGTGKSTFIKELLKGENSALKLGSNQQVGYLSQIIEFDDKKTSLLQYFIDETGLNDEISRSKLFKFQFYKQDLTKRVGSLSGGEKLRLKLAIMLQHNINFLILDEPTNHIDIETREVLEETLKDFKGTMLFVSHDRYFINKIATKILEIHNKKIYTFNGDYDYYLQTKENVHKKYWQIKIFIIE